MPKQYHIKQNGKLIPVSEAVYRACQRPKWREKKQKEVRDKVECSFEAIRESGLEYKANLAQPGVDEIIAHKLLLDALVEAIAALDEDERDLIYALFYKGQSERSYSEEIGVPRKTLAYRKDKVFEKIRKIIEKN